MEQQNCQEETTNSESPLQGGNEPQGVKMSVENSKANGEGLNRQNQKVTLKPVPTSGRFKVILSIVITANLEFNSTCRRKKHSLLHWNTLMLPGPLILIWTSCKKSVLMTAGISILREVREILGKGSQNSLCWKKNLPKDLCVVRGETEQSSNDYETRSCMAWSTEQNWESRSESRKTRTEKRETKTRQCSTTERNPLHWSGWRRTQGNSLNARIKLERPMDADMPCKRRFVLAPGNRQRSWMHLTRFQRQNMVEKWNLMNPQGNEWKPLCQKNHKRPHYRQRKNFDDPLQFGSQIYSYATSDDNSGGKSSSG